MKAPVGASLFELERREAEQPDRSLPVLPPALELLRQVYSMGGWIARNGDQLRLLAVPGSLPLSFVSQLSAHRSEILELLTSYPCSGCGRHAFPTLGTLCYWCRRGGGGAP